MDIYKFSLATQDNLYEILNFYHGLIGTPGCTWHLDYPNQDIVQSDIDSKSLYILRDQENVLIAVAAAGVSDELNDLQWSISNPCDLARIGVTSTKQKQGIGTIMLKNIINAVKERGFDGIRLLVSKKNPAAIALYSKNGFHLCGEAFMFGIDFYCYEMLFDRTE